MVVVDASLAVEFALDRIGQRAGADLDRGGELIAPPLLWSEVHSGGTLMSLIGAKSSTFTSSYSGLEAAGNIARISNSKTGALS